MNCPICKNKTDFFYLFKDESVIQNNPCFSLKKALNCQKGNIDLYGCKNCGFAFNAAFSPKKIKYSFNYDNSQEYSFYFSGYLKRIVKNLIKKYNLKNKNVIEVGCGKGYFLRLLYDEGVKNIRGFDPSYINFDPIIDKLVSKKIFNVKNIKIKADFIICRHVLEHIKNPKKFIFSITECLNNRGSMYFEFPNLRWIVKNKTFFDFFYEHCNYFSKKSVIKLFNEVGFKNINFKYGLNGQYFQLEINRFPDKKYLFNPINFLQFSQSIDRKINYYKSFINKLENFAVWGAGAKGVTFVNRVGISRRKCPYVIDINPNKQGRFIPITGQKIVSPEILKTKKIENIIIMNQIYKKEIKEKLLTNNYQAKIILL